MIMKTRSILGVGAVSVGLVAVGGASHFVRAQQSSPSRVQIECERLHFVRGSAGTAEGNVKLSRLDAGPITLAAAPDGLVYTCEEMPATTPSTIKVPMDMATLRVSVTASGTVFEDAKGDKLSVRTQASP